MGKRLTLLVALAAVVATALTLVAATAGADIKPKSKSEHWGVNLRNTIGSPVGELRDGPYGSFGVTGDAARPPYGKGSLMLAVSDDGTYEEKVDFGNEVAYFGEPVLDLTDTGFHVFNTGENGASNMPNIRFEIDPNLTATPSNYTTMVWVPGPSPVTNEWSGYIDATSSGRWYFTGAAGAVTGCTTTDPTPCTFADAMAALDDGGDEPTFYTVNVGKGRDSAWVGAIDGFRINTKIYDFEENGTFERNA